MAWLDGWSGRFSVTTDPDDITAAVTDLALDLGLKAPAAFWSAVKSDGGDIRVTTSDGETEVARQVSWIDTGAEKGSLYFRATGLSTSVATVYYVYYGNSGASEPAVGAANGRNAVWAGGAYNGVWNFDEASGDLLDSTGNGLTAVANGTPTYAQAAQLGRGILFDGSTDYFRVAPDALIQPGKLTLWALARPDPTGGAWGHLISQPYGSTWATPFRSYGVFRSDTTDDWSGWIRDVTTESATVADQWTDDWRTLGITWDASILRTYGDGSAGGTSSGSGDIGYGGDGDDSLIFGQRSEDTPGEYFKGLIGGVRLLNAAQSAAWFATHHAVIFGQSTFWTAGAAESAGVEDSITAGAEADADVAASVNQPEGVTAGAEAGDAVAPGVTTSAGVTEGAEADAAFGYFLPGIPRAIEAGAEAGEQFGAEVAATGSVEEGAEADDVFGPTAATEAGIAAGAEAGDTFGGSVDDSTARAIEHGAEAGDFFAAVVDATPSFEAGAEAGGEFRHNRDLPLFVGALNVPIPQAIGSIRIEGVPRDIRSRGYAGNLQCADRGGRRRIILPASQLVDWSDMEALEAALVGPGSVSLAGLLIGAEADFTITDGPHRVGADESASKCAIGFTGLEVLSS